MNLVRTYIDKSLIEGLGMFADEDIPKGTIIWKFEEPDWCISEREFKQRIKDEVYTQVEIDNINKYASKFNGLVTYYADEAKYCNHSNNANTYTDEFERQVAKVDIKKGEEITCNYNEFDDEGGN